MSLPKSLNDIDIDSLGIESMIKKEPEKRAQFSVIYGKGGVGKSTAACYSTAPIILPVGRETGHEGMYIPKFPSAHDMELDPINHVFSCIAWMLKKEHTRRTLIIDNLGSFREAVDEDVESGNKDTDLKAYGRGAALAYPYYTRLLSAIDALMKKRSVNVILLAHDGNYNVNMADGTYYSRTSMNAPRGENTNVMGLIEARAHNVFYMRGEANTAKDKSGKKYATAGSIQRVIYTKPRGEFFAKSRVNLEEYYEIGMSDTEEELLKKLSNEDLIKFWADVYV